MGSLSVSNLIVSIGVAFDAQLKAADNLFFATAVDFADPTRPLFAGPLGNSAGEATSLSDTDAVGFASSVNAISGDPATIRQIATSEGPRYQLTDKNGFEIKTDNANLRNVPRYIVKSDGIVYDMLVPSTPQGTGKYDVANPAIVNGGTGLGQAASAAFQPSQVTLRHYARPVGRITFKAKEGATLARAQDDLQRTSSIVQLLTRLLESIQDEAKGFSSLIR